MDQHKRYATEQLSLIAKKLEGMPQASPPDRHNKQQAIRFLEGEIAAMQARGYTLDQISAALEREGLEITKKTLATYLHKIRREPSSKPNQKPHAKSRPIQKAKPPQLVGSSISTLKEGTSTFVPRADSTDI